jgi:heterodisulfide reductase subunit C
VKAILAADALRPEMLAEVERQSGQHVRECYQCGKCSAGCPIFGDPDGRDMDLPPNQVMRLLQLGLGKAALRSRTIWLCAGCETCTTRCPREVDLASVMEALRIMALEEGITPPGLRNIPLFNKLFLKNIRRFGRLYEMELIGKFNMFSLQPLKDFFKSPGLFFKGRLKLFPRFKGRKTAVPGFEDARRAEEESEQA